MTALMKRIANRVINRIQWELNDKQASKPFSLKPPGKSKGNVLFSYIIGGFSRQPGHQISNSHTNYWESVQMVKTFLDLGYAVDVIDYEGRSFKPRKNYDIFVDSRFNLQMLSPLIKPDCIKIAHLDISHILFHTTAEMKRLLELQQQDGLTLAPRRFEPPNLLIQHADYATIHGNQFTIDTYKHYKKPIYRIPMPVATQYPWPEEKDFEACRKNFLYFSSGGLVLKGLHLVLKAFAAMPDYHLTVCGPVQKEADFEQAFYRELYQTPNIHTVGWVDVSSLQFQNILNHCVGLVYPSGSEGQAGAAITCLHAGLIPIMSYETGVDAGDFGVILQDCSVEQIQQEIQKLAALPAATLKQRARSAWEFARANHTREKFALDYRQIIQQILKERGLETIS